MKKITVCYQPSKTHVTRISRHRFSGTMPPVGQLYCNYSIERRGALHSTQDAVIHYDSIGTATAPQQEACKISKTQIKRSAQAVQALGVALVALSPTLLKKIDLPDPLRQAIALAQRLKREGLRRQLNYISKLLRATPLEPIQHALHTIKHSYRQQCHHRQQLAHHCAQLITAGDRSIQALVEKFPQLDRHHLRTLVRKARNTEQNKQMHTPAYYALWRYLHTEGIT